MENHVKAAGWANILDSSLLMVVFLMPMLGGAAFVDWYFRVFSMPVLEPREEFIASVTNFFKIAGFIWAVILLAYLSSSIGLLKLKPWARKTTLVFNFLTLGALPLGPFVGGYSIWVLFHKEAKSLFESTQTNQIASSV